MTTARPSRSSLLISSLFFLFLFLSGHAMMRGQSDNPDSLLLEACLNGQADEAERLLDEGGANQDARREGDRWTPLMLAAMNGYTEIVQLLLNHDANPNLGSDDEGTALCVAAASFMMPQEGPTAIIDLLLERGADMTKGNGSRMTPLMYAAREGKVEVVQRLLEAGADPNYDDVRQWTALWMAVNNDQTEVVRILLEAGADPNVQGEMSQWTALSIAVQNNNTEIAGMLLEAGADPNGRPGGVDYFASPLWFAAQHDNLDLVRLLLEKDALPNYSDGGYLSEDEKPRTPLDWAKEHENSEMEEMLLEAGALHNLEEAYGAMLDAIRDNNANLFAGFMEKRIDPRRYIYSESEEGTSLLNEAAIRGNIDIIRAILAFPLQPNSYELYSAYQVAVANEFSEVAEEILQSAPGPIALQTIDASEVELLRHILEIDPGVADYSGWDGQTPLHLAAQTGNLEMASMLLEAGATVDMPDRWGESPLFGAVRIGASEIGELLLEYGADVEYRSKNGMTPLHAAALSVHDEIIEWLLEHDATLYATDYQGWNALHFAAWGGAASTVSLLLDLGIEPDWKTDQGETALEIATRSENSGTLEVLEGLETGKGDE